MEQGEIELGEVIPPAGPNLPGPFPVGRYARQFQAWMRERARVQLIGEVTGVGRSKVQAYFELRDSQGAVPCAIWLNDLEKAGLPEGYYENTPPACEPAVRWRLPGMYPAAYSSACRTSITRFSRPPRAAGPSAASRAAS